MPILWRNSITSGVWNEMPKINGSMSAKLSHSLSRKSGSSPIHSLKHSNTSMALGITRN